MSRLSDQGLAKLIERQMAMSRARGRAAEQVGQWRPGDPVTAVAAAPYVTVSRQYGAGGSVLARQVAERLDWALYDRELLEAIARDGGLQEELLQPLDERERSDMEVWIRNLLTEDTISEHYYTRSLFRVLSSIAKVGYAVVVGRGAHLALPADKGLRVRVYAPLEYRAQQVSEREGMSLAEAIETVKRIDLSRQLWLTHAYGAAAREPMAFDMAVNPAAVPMTACVEMVLCALSAKCGAEVLTRPMAPV